MDWFKNALKKYSVQGMSVALAVQSAWMLIPEKLQVYAPDWVTQGVVLCALVYALVGRFLPQPSVPE